MKELPTVWAVEKYSEYFYQYLCPFCSGKFMFTADSQSAQEAVTEKGSHKCCSECKPESRFTVRIRPADPKEKLDA